MTTPSNWRSGYIVNVGDRAEAELLRKLLQGHGIHCWIKRNHHRFRLSLPLDWLLYCHPEDCLRARELKRGFKTAQTIRGPLFDFLLGLRAGLLARNKQVPPEIMQRAFRELPGVL